MYKMSATQGTTMDYLPWIFIAGLIVVLILLRKASGHSSREVALTNFIVLLMLDEDTYKTQRSDFERLVRRLRVRSRKTIYVAASLQLSKDATRIGWGVAQANSHRMWKLNQEAIEKNAAEKIDEKYQLQSSVDFAEKLGELETKFKTSLRKVFRIR